MKIALIRRFCSLKMAGAERYCVLLGRQLQQLGHDVTLVGEGIDESLKKEFPFLRVPVNRITSWTRNRSFATNTRSLLQGHSFDVIHSLSRVPGVDTFRLTDPLQAHWVHVYYQHSWWRKIQLWNPRHRTIFQLEKELYQRAGARMIITQSELDSRLLSEYYGVPEDRIRRIPNAVDRQQFFPVEQTAREELRSLHGIERTRTVLVFAGMDFRRKGLATAIQSLAQLKDQSAILLVAGDGPLQTYQKLARRLGLANRVRFLGRVSRMADLYRVGDLFLLPTIYEPFPNVILEAMACGLPVISSATAGGTEAIRERVNGYLLNNPFDAEELAGLIDTHLALGALEKEAFSRSSIEGIREFTWERNVGQTLALFNEVLSEKRAA